MKAKTVAIFKSALKERDNLPYTARLIEAGCIWSLVMPLPRAAHAVSLAVVLMIGTGAFMLGMIDATSAPPPLQS